MKRLSALAVSALGAGIVAVGMSGVAYAYWQTMGSGSDSDTGSNGLSAFHTTATVAQGALLYPGGSAPLTVNVDNTGNTYALTVTSVALDGSRSITVDAGHSASCLTTAISVSTPAAWAGITVAPNSSSGATTIPTAVSMGPGADNGCQGAIFSIPVTLTGRN
jgi:hypothetical protein